MNPRRQTSVLTPGIRPDEYRSRFEALRSLVEEAGLDLFIVSSSESIYYLTGASFEPLERPFFMLVRPRGQAVLLVPRLESEHMKKAHNVAADQVNSYREYPAPEGEGWSECLLALVDRDQQIGVEPSIPLGTSAQLEEYALRVAPLVDQLRRVKSPAEIAMIQRAARYADYAVERLMRVSYSGAAVAEGFGETRTVTSRIIREVDHWEPLTTKVVMATWAAPRSAMPHSVPELGDRLGDGPHIALALTRVNGYAAECERTYFTAPPSAGVRRAFATVTEARRIAFDMIRPGLPCADLDRAVNEFLSDEGYSGEDQRLHRAGHGFGLGNHEPPWVAEGSRDRLAENMVISIEPGIYFPGIGGVRHSDTVRVTSDGYELLTHYPRELDRLTILKSKATSRIKGWMVRRTLHLDPAGRS